MGAQHPVDAYYACKQMFTIQVNHRLRSRCSVIDYYNKIKSEQLNLAFMTIHCMASTYLFKCNFLQNSLHKPGILISVLHTQYIFSA